MKARSYWSRWSGWPLSGLTTKIIYGLTWLYTNAYCLYTLAVFATVRAKKVFHAHEKIIIAYCSTKCGHYSIVDWPHFTKSTIQAKTLISRSESMERLVLWRGTQLLWIMLLYPLRLHQNQSQSTENAKFFWGGGGGGGGHAPRLP